jgi:hypothetical protein
MQYQSARGGIGWRPLGDINARLTMGRVALGFARRMAPEEWSIWLHVRCDASASDFATALEQIAAGLPAGVRVQCTSPRTAGGIPLSRASILVSASSPGLRETAESSLRAAFA